MESNEHPYVNDLGDLFLYSGMVDSLRDAARLLLRCQVDEGTREHMVDQYQRLRTRLVPVLAAGLGPEALERTPELEDGTDVAGVYVAATLLARWCDLAHQGPRLLLAQQMAEAAAAQVSAEIAKGGAESPERSMGQYL